MQVWDTRGRSDYPGQYHGVILLLTPDELKNIPDGVLLRCIGGTVAFKGKDRIDDDTRGGHLAYGLPLIVDEALCKPGS